MIHEDGRLLRPFIFIINVFEVLMKNLMFLSVFFISFGFLSCQSDLKKDDLKDQKDKISYGIGLDIGRNLRSQNIEINIPSFAQGVKDGLISDSTMLLTEDELRQAFTEFQKEMMKKQEEEWLKMGERNKIESEEFLKQNKTKEGVVTLASGLQYKVLKSGNGAIPKATDKVKVHYSGRLLNGTIFDSSYERGEPTVFEVSKLIKGWIEALQLMKTGDKWELYIPSDLAYGPNGAGQMIGPDQALIFEMELISIEK